MRKVVNTVKKEIIHQINDLKPDGLKEVLDFVLFVKVKKTIEPSQAYFWTKTWQRLEKEVDEDKRARRVMGDGTVEGLMKTIKS
jgi:hypothetical protein